MLDDISLYWLTASGASAAQIYWEIIPTISMRSTSPELPVAVTVFPGEIYCAPRSWTERCYHNLIYFNKARTAAISQLGNSQKSSHSEGTRAAFSALR